jgi:hypothetical protein
MHFRLLACLFVTFSLSAFANGRAPAVEDFVGIEVEHVQSTPNGSESLYNLESDIQKVQANGTPVTKVYKESAPEIGPATVIAGAFFALLPMIVALFMMNKLRRKAGLESASNIEVLEKYRKDREAKKSQEVKKAS